MKTYTQSEVDELIAQAVKLALEVAPLQWSKTNDGKTEFCITPIAKYEITEDEEGVELMYSDVNEDAWGYFHSVENAKAEAQRDYEETLTCARSGSYN